MNGFRVSCFKFKVSENRRPTSDSLVSLLSLRGFYFIFLHYNKPKVTWRLLQQVRELLLRITWQQLTSKYFNKLFWHIHRWAVSQSEDFKVMTSLSGLSNPSKSMHPHENDNECHLDDTTLYVNFWLSFKKKIENNTSLKSKTKYRNPFKHKKKNKPDKTELRRLISWQQGSLGDKQAHVIIILYRTYKWVWDIFPCIFSFFHQEWIVFAKKTPKITAQVKYL